jgi:D-lactate dehydrogenase
VYTERCLWCKVHEDGQVELFNTTGFDAPTEEELLRMIDKGAVARPALSPGSVGDGVDMGPLSRPPPSSMSLPPASDAVRYCQDLCDHSQEQETKVSRFNADTRGIDPVRSEGKVLILASVHDTFPVPRTVRNVWVSCDSLVTAQNMKKQVLLVNPADLPISCEYMNKDTMDVVDQGGRALCHSLLRFGIGPQFEHLWDLKIKIESMKKFGSVFETLPDRFLYAVNSLFPSVLPSEVVALSNQFDHHLLISVGDFGNEEISHFEERLALFLSSEKEAGSGESVCVRNLDVKEAKRIGVFRFAAAPAFRTWCVGRNLSGISLDYALPKNHTTSPDVDVGPLPVVRCRYSHFGCNVVHEDVAFESSVDVHARKMDIKHVVEQEGGKLPAEHGHGTEYAAPTQTQSRWMSMDPTNVFNPGVGGTRTEKFYGKVVPKDRR